MFDFVTYNIVILVNAVIKWCTYFTEHILFTNVMCLSICKKLVIQNS